MLDLLFVLVMLTLFVLGLLYVHGCERLQK
jgi:hypothetical protein